MVLRGDNVIQELEALLPKVNDLDRRAAMGGVAAIVCETTSGELISSWTTPALQYNGGS